MNKNFCFLGDSITEGVGVKVGERYFDLLSNEFGFNAFGFGVNGASSKSMIDQIDKMIEKNLDQVDLISVLIGTNDFYGSVPIGTFFTEAEKTVCVLRDEKGNSVKEEKRKKREFNFDENTFCGRLNLVFRKIREHYPRTIIVIMTPLHRAFACFSNENIQYDELYSNRIGLFIEDYVNAIRKCADVWAVKLIDLYRESELFPLFDKDAQEYFCSVDTDRLHPNRNGHAQIARAMKPFIVQYCKE